MGLVEVIEDKAYHCKGGKEEGDENENSKSKEGRKGGRTVSSGLLARDVVLPPIHPLEEEEGGREAGREGRNVP